MALLAMFAYHFSFDLAWFGVIRANPYESPLWIASRTLILSSFLLLAGASLALAHAQGIRWPRFWRRLAQIAGCAVLVSAGSALAFPDSWIWFGVLHHLAVASLIGLACLRLGWANLALGVGLIGVGAAFKLPTFDAPALQWIGLMTYKPVTEDYVPLLPWVGVVLVGIVLGGRLAAAPPPSLVRWRPSAAPARLRVLAGRHTLLLYVVHQPVFIGLLWLVLPAR